MSIHWTPRNTVSLILLLLTATAYALAVFDVVHLDFVSNGKIEAYALGFGFGVVMPGSPIGRVLDKLFPPTGQTKQPITSADVTAVIEDVEKNATALPTSLGGEPPRPQQVPSRTDGSASVDALGVILVIGGIVLAWLRHLMPVLLVVTVASLASGCGAGALVAQGRAATIVGVGLGSVAQEVHDERAAQLDACTDAGCLDAGERLWAPAVAAVESARTALATWIDSLAVASQAGAEDGDVIGALLVAVSHFVREWNDLAAAIRALNDPNLQPPDLPPVVTALLDAIGGAS